MSRGQWQPLARLAPWIVAPGPWAVAALAVIAVLDAVAAARSWPVPVVALLDEPAHLLTAALFLAALAPRPPLRVWPWVLLGAVAIDLDHVPLYLWGVGTATGNGRPVTHSLLTAAVLLVAGLLVRRVRIPLCGLGVGVLLHLVRDLATGPGAPLLWPADARNLLVPYAAYVVALVVLTGIAVARWWFRPAGYPGRSRPRSVRRRKRAQSQSAQSLPRR